MKHEGSWILVCSTGQAEDGHLLMLTMGEAQVFGSFFVSAYISSKELHFL
jgi:hypothetical protein